MNELDEIFKRIEFEAITTFFQSREDGDPKHRFKFEKKAKQALNSYVLKKQIEELFRMKGVTFESVDNPVNQQVQEYLDGRIKALQPRG